MASGNLPEVAFNLHVSHQHPLGRRSTKPVRQGGQCLPVLFLYISKLVLRNKTTISVLKPNLANLLSRCSLCKPPEHSVSPELYYPQKQGEHYHFSCHLCCSSNFLPKHHFFSALSIIFLNNGGGGGESSLRNAAFFISRHTHCSACPFLLDTRCSAGCVTVGHSSLRHVHLCLCVRYVSVCASALTRM